jgi:ATP-binding cassette, subfamily B, multidrug efflux pump
MALGRIESLMLPKSLRPLKPYLWKYRWQYLFSLFTVVANNAIWVQFPLVIGMAIDDLNRGTTRNITRYALLLLAITCGKGVFQFLMRWKMIGISREIEFDLRNDLFTHLESLPYSYYQRNRTGDIMARATNDLNAVRNLLGPAIMYSANTIGFMAFALYNMWHISPRLMLFAFLPLPIASVLVQNLARKIHERFERIQAMFSDISARAQENFSGARVVRAYAQEEAEIRSFEGANQEYIARSLRLVRLMGMLWPTLEAMLALGIVLTLWLGSREVLLHHIDVGQFVAFNTYIVMLTWPVIALGWVINIFQRGTASMIRINEILIEKPEIQDAPGVNLQTDFTGEVEFRDLNFSFNGTRVLRNVNLRVPAGTSLAIVGPTGSGKTTLVNLIPRIYDAAPGMVLIDGKPIREFPLQQLRHNIGFVPQETFLFSDTIAENIAFGAAETDPTAKKMAIERAAEASNIAEDVAGFPQGYETVVGERGITLSGGQKQRTAIARAIIRQPRILILDDALSSVDTHTEEQILDHLREIMRDRTTIFISHRVSTVRNADKIAVLHDGSIVEYGTHEELIERNGYYTERYNKQLLEEELETV